MVQVHRGEGVRLSRANVGPGAAELGGYLLPLMILRPKTPPAMLPVRACATGAASAEKSTPHPTEHVTNTTVNNRVVFMADSFTSRSRPCWGLNPGPLLAGRRTSPNARCQQRLFTVQAWTPKFHKSAERPSPFAGCGAGEHARRPIARDTNANAGNAARKAGLIAVRGVGMTHPFGVIWPKPLKAGWGPRTR